MTLREGDIEAIRRKQELEGKPIKSNRIFDKDRTIEYKRDKKGRVRITDDGED